jgi:hypothetical protein
MHRSKIALLNIAPLLDVPIVQRRQKFFVAAD